MALADRRISIIALPQRWAADAAGAMALELNVVLLPATDPTSPLLPAGGTAFCAHAPVLDVAVVAGTGGLPAPGAATVVDTITLPAPALGAAAWQAMAGPNTPADGAQRGGVPAAMTILKPLPASYLEHTGGVARTPYGIIGEEYGCALRAMDTKGTGRKPADDRLTWGTLISGALRQPDLARGLGLIRTLTVGAAALGGALDAGGFLLVRPAATDALLAAVPGDEVGVYAARVPALRGPRALFAAVVFPVTSTPGGGAPLADAEAQLDEVQHEALTYDDGFARLVHCAQPDTLDAASGDHAKLPATTEVGLQIGWDDEQVALWQNRQLEIARLRTVPGAQRLDSPMTVAGYRVDVRSAADPTWVSLCRADLHFDPALAATFGLADGVRDLTVEALPIRADRPDDTRAWLPRYFAQWNGGCLVAEDPVMRRLLPANGVAPAVAPAADWRTPVGVALQYGETYAFRVRLGDLSGGGPLASDGPEHTDATHVATRRFVRMIPPRAPAIGAFAPDPAPATLTVARPLVGFPEAACAAPLTAAQLEALAARVGDPAVDVVGIDDPDVDTLRVEVEARLAPLDSIPPDPGAPETPPGWKHLYSVDIAWPGGADPLTPGPAMTLALDYQAIAQLDDIVAPAAGTTTLPLPAARDLRLRVRGVSAVTPSRFGTHALQVGHAATVALRAEETATVTAVLGADPPRVSGLLLEDAPEALTRLAHALDLVAAPGLALGPRPGERALLAAAPAIKHHTSPDGAVLSFATQHELVERWLVAVDLRIDRDWSWDGLDPAGFELLRQDSAAAPPVVVARAHPPGPVSALARRDDGPSGPDHRRHSRVLFLDAIDPAPARDAFATELAPTYTVQWRVRRPGGLTDEQRSTPVTLGLPVACAPAQMPTLVSAGLARSPYARNADYSASEPRTEALWLEFDAPPRDRNTAYFARVLAYAPDPLLVASPQDRQAIAEPPLPIPAEPLRRIEPGMSDDRAGLDAMAPLVASTTDPNRYVLPLPPGHDVDSRRLFGMWTYEVRLGYLATPPKAGDPGLWSTARARFGRPLRIAGVQHPAPPLHCDVGRIVPGLEREGAILVTAPYAAPVADDGTLLTPQLVHPDPADDRRRIVSPRPATTLLAALYTQVRTVDGADARNVLLTREEMVPLDDSSPPTGMASFGDPAIRERCAELGISVDAPLSVLVIELLHPDPPRRLRGTIVPRDHDDPDERRREREDREPDLRGLSARILRTSALTPAAAMCPVATMPLPELV